MLEKSFGVFFYLKHSKSKRKRISYVYLRITVDGFSKELSTKRVWKASQWNSKAGRAMGAKEDAKALNNYLDTLISKVYGAKRELIEVGKTVTAEAIKEVITGKAGDKKMILEIFQHHNDQIKALLDSEYAPGTLQRYYTSLDHTRSFIRWKYNLEDIDIHKLNYDFISEYAFWLKSVRHCSHNTTVKYLSNFKKIVLKWGLLNNKI